MKGTIAQRGPALRIRTLSLAALGTAVVVTGAAVVPKLFSDDEGLPQEVGNTIPRNFTITYRVVAGKTVTTDVLTVRRPFDSRLVTHEGGSAKGRVLSQRASGFGLLATTSGSAWGRLGVPPALASADLRPDAALRDAVGAGIVDDLGAGAVGGRACRRYVMATSVAGGTLEAPGDDERAEVCIDAVGIVLRERWTVDGDLVRTKEAIALSVDDSGDADSLAVPAGQAIPGGGSVRRLADDAAVPFANPVALDAVPAGFKLRGRYAVVPPDASSEQPAGDAPSAHEIATVTDVWVRGADLLILDQGATTGRDPFQPTEVGAPLDLGDAGFTNAMVVLDLRASEIRIRLAEGGFVRISATLGLDALLDVARSLRFVEGEADARAA